ncbi:MAG: nuclear transport factor 2 family protein [Flavobacteriaceae bacterium]|nr:nuclear transport factor 2 family protein [Flavobacteriaceae bacterium]
MVTTDKGNTWVYFWGNWKGTLAANNKELEIPVHLALRFADGKIAREEGFYNLSEFTAALQKIEATKMAEEKATTE